MRKYLEAGSQEVEKYLMSEFGNMQTFDGCVMMPPRKAIIKVEEPLQTCHPSSGSGLDESNCIPPGIYEVGEMSAGMTSHWGNLSQTLWGGHDVRFCAGYCDISGNNTIDWRGAKNFIAQST